MRRHLVGLRGWVVFGVGLVFPAACFPGALNEIGKLCSDARRCTEPLVCAAGMCQSEGGAQLVDPGTTWRFRDDGADLAPDWRGPGYDDGAWASGAAPLGYGMLGLGTGLCCDPDGGIGHLTNYFRRSFATTPSNWRALEVRVRRDDGAVVYLNGQEVFRTAMPAGPVNATTAAIHTTGADETNFFEVVIDVGVLVEGSNVAAVEVHQDRATSSDMVFDFDLRGVP